MRIISKDGLTDVDYGQSIVFYDGKSVFAFANNGSVFNLVKCREEDEAKKILTHIRHCYIEGRSYCHINDYYEKKEKEERERKIRKMEELSWR